MAATRALTIPDVYDRFVKGKKVSVEEWDYKITPGNLTALKEKYNIKFEPDQISSPTRLSPRTRTSATGCSRPDSRCWSPPDTTTRTWAASCT